MSKDNLARHLSVAEEPGGDPIYDALVAALRSNARGRAFLDEYARRARAADTAAALAALERIEALLARQRDDGETAAVEPDDVFVPLEVELLTDIAAPDEAPAHREPDPPRRSAAGLLAQVMALSPEERIALFS